MSSSINPYNVDATFPVAGQDNSSQGFRDNFASIQNNFIFTKADIDDLQSKVLVTGPLSGQTLNNDLAGTTLSRPQLKSWTQAPYDLGTASTNASLDFTVANFQMFTTAGAGAATAIQFLHCPIVAGTGVTGYSVMRVWINVIGVADTIVLPGSVTIGVNSIAGYSAGTISFSTIGAYIYEFSSIDGGNSYLISEVSRADSSVAVGGNLTIGGGRIESGYQYSAAVTGFHITVTPDKSRLILDPAGTLAQGNITLPTGNVDARTITISSTATITALAVAGNPGTSVRPSANITLSAGSGATYFYHQAESTWYKIG